LITIKGGLYLLEKPVIFTFEDSGSKDSPTIYQSAEGGGPVFTGSYHLKNWQLHRNPDQLELLDKKVRGKFI
jgi:hypothetical protein